MTVEYVVNIREPMPPHSIIATFPNIGIRHGLELMRPQRASFRISRGDPNIGALGALRVGLMATIERTDELLPWVGYVTDYAAPRGDPEVSLTATDHTWLLQQAVTKRSGSYQGASGTLIVATLSEINSRGAPPLPIRLAGLPGGPTMDYDYRMSKADEFLRTVVDATGYEWGWNWAVTRGDVVTSLLWAPAIGEDLTSEVVWEENVHLAAVAYGQHASGYLAASVAVGGSGAIALRPAAAVSISGQPVVGVGATTIGGVAQTSPALMGTRTLIDQQVSLSDALAAAARRLWKKPDQAGETLSFKVAEPMIDPATLAVGNIITVRLADTNLGSPLERRVRIVAIQVDASSGVHDVEGQVV